MEAATAFAGAPTDYSANTVWVADSLDLPIRVETMGLVQENRDLKGGPQPAALFEIPAGFVKTSAPGMPAGTAPPSPSATPTPPRAAPAYGGKSAQGAARIQQPARSEIWLEADELRIMRRTSGQAGPARLAQYGYAAAGAFTGDRTLSWRNAQDAGAVLELILPAEKKGRYRLSLHLGKYRTFGQFQFLLNGKPAGKPVDMFGNPGQDIVAAFTVELGEADLRAGDNRLGIRLVGTNPETVMPNHGAGLDWIRLTPVETSGSKGKSPAEPGRREP